jgi:antitoxin component of RelBE/YafQ-DinJ toxin-antitoxin module
MARKDAPLAFRIPADLKEELQRISEKEARSVSQICELFLTICADQYRKEGRRFWDKYFDQKH